jgi:hypothetical protein
MNVVLKKHVDMKLIIFPITLVIILLNITNNNALSPIAPYAILGLSILYGVRIYKEFKNPAAKISDGVLTIYDQGSSQTIEKDKIEHFEYIESSKSLHEIHVKLKDYQPWVIELRNSQHIKSNRLYNFINQNFWEIIPNQSLKKGRREAAPLS